MFGNFLTLTRRGLQDGGSYGLIDDLTFTLTGNQVTKIEDAATDPTYYGVFNFNDGASQSNEYTYDKNGNMTKDLNPNRSLGPISSGDVKVFSCSPESKECLPLIHGSHET